MKTFVKGVLILFAIIAGMVLSFFCSVAAAKFAGGLRIDAWGLGSAYTMIFGGAAGLVVALIVGIALACRNPYVVNAIISSIANSDQTPSDVLQKIVKHKVGEIGQMYPRHVIKSARSTLLKRGAGSSANN